MKFLCKFIGGSRGYGIDNAESDIDRRGIFLNTEVGQLIGLDRFEHQELKKDLEDEVNIEFRHFLCLCRKSGTNAIEILFNENWEQKEKEFDFVIQNRAKLIDIEKFYVSLKGFMQNEKKLANGERKGKVGGKRKAAIDKIGYSPKNFVQLMRLAYCGIRLFKVGVFPVNLLSYDKDFAEQLIDIKTNPKDYSKDDLNIAVEQMEVKLDEAFTSKKADYKFDNDFANELCLRFYFPIIRSVHDKMTGEKIDIMNLLSGICGS